MCGLELEKVFVIRKTRETELDGGTEDMESECSSRACEFIKAKCIYQIKTIAQHMAQ